jgi:hypothetical protein
MFRALKRLLQRGMLDPAQLTLRLFGPSDAASVRDGARDGARDGVRDGLRDGVREGVKAPPVRRRRPRTRRPAGPPAAPPAETAEPVSPTRPSARRRRARPPEEDDAAVVAKLVAQHAEYNAKRFGGTLRTVPIAISPRMRSRLGYYRLANKTTPAMIMISRGHLRRHGWDEVFQTLLHEMVHQWQAETGQPVDHGAQFRDKARAVGAVPRARRPVGSE